MKYCMLSLLILVSSSLIAQKVDLSEKQSVIEYLNKREFQVGPYGKMTMYFDEYDRDFKSLKFKVEFIAMSSDKKSDKYKLQTDVFMMDGFYLPTYMTGFSLKTPNALVNDAYDFPTNFLLFENGELYYSERTNMSMEDYIKAIKTGGELKTQKHVLCK